MTSADTKNGFVIELEYITPKLDAQVENINNDVNHISKKYFSPTSSKIDVSKKLRKGHRRCPFCKKVISSSSNLKRHLKVIHAANIVYTKNLKYPCTHCKRQFSHRNDFKKHLRKIHDISGNEIKCCLCDFKNNEKLIINHYINEHKIEIEQEELNFKSIQEFKEWKLSTEQSSGSKFIMNRSSLKNGIKYVYYICHHSNYFKPKEQRKKSVKGLDRKKNVCTAKINTICRKDGNIFVHYVKTHVNHRKNENFTNNNNNVKSTDDIINSEFDFNVVENIVIGNSSTSHSEDKHKSDAVDVSNGNLNYDVENSVRENSGSCDLVSEPVSDTTDLINSSPNFNIVENIGLEIGNNCHLVTSHFFNTADIIHCSENFDVVENIVIENSNNCHLVNPHASNTSDIINNNSENYSVIKNIVMENSCHLINQQVSDASDMINSDPNFGIVENIDNPNDGHLMNNLILDPVSCQEMKDKYMKEIADILGSIKTQSGWNYVEKVLCIMRSKITSINAENLTDSTYKEAKKFSRQAILELCPDNFNVLTSCDETFRTISSILFENHIEQNIT